MDACRQRGQALVLGLFLLFVGTISLFYLFSTGQVSADKQRVTNAADAAAYSAALWRARVLNYDAYANRAMIANEAAIAQSLTLASETQYLKNFAACLAMESGDGGWMCESALPYLLAFIPYVTAAFSAVRTVLEYYDTGLQYALMAEVTARSAAANRAMSLSQTALHVSTNFVALETIADQVAQANDPNFEAQVMPDNFEGPGSFTRRYNDDDRNRLANIVRESTDGYTRDRRFTIRPLPAIGFPICFGYEYRKRGGTQLSDTLDRWEAVDDLSEWQLRSRKLRCQWDEHPLSWASRRTVGESDPNPIGVADNPEALDRSRDPSVAYTIDDSLYVGIQPFRDLNYETLSGRNGDTEVRNPRHRLHVVVRMGGENLRTANMLNVGVGRLRMRENLNQNEIRTIAAAEVYFRRPAPRSDGRTELPSLFNPYWQARLTEVDPLQRVAAAAL